MCRNAGLTQLLALNTETLKLWWHAGWRMMRIRYHLRIFEATAVKPLPGVCMSTIDISRSHSLDHAHAREAAESLAKDLSEQFDVDYTWEGDTLRFKRSGVKGHMDVLPAELKVHLELGLMLRPFKSRFESEIHSQLDKLTGTA